MASIQTTTFKMNVPDDETSTDSNKYLKRRRDLDTKKVVLDELLKRKFDGKPLAGKSKFKEKLAIFDEKIKNVEENLHKNPFSDKCTVKKYNKNSTDYGRPEVGSLTEKRGIKAGNNVSKEILELCQVIDDCGFERPDGVKIIKFGRLFNLYTKISDKVVGMLLRARKHGLVTFVGEMLYQRRDEETIIELKKPYSEIEKMFKQSNDPAKCLTLSSD